jgi:hypothetical protein
VARQTEHDFYGKKKSKEKEKAIELLTMRPKAVSICVVKSNQIVSVYPFSSSYGRTLLELKINMIRFFINKNFDKFPHRIDFGPWSGYSGPIWNGHILLFYDCNLQLNTKLYLFCTKLSTICLFVIVEQTQYIGLFYACIRIQWILHASDYELQQIKLETDLFCRCV